MSSPSSGPSGHLLPAGEKRESVALFEAIDREFEIAANVLFSPAGRRWPEGPDEGVLL